MQLGMVGLGRMGGNMVRRLMRNGHTCVVYDRSAEAVETLVKEGATGASSLADFASKLESPRTAWVMLPAGEITENTIHELAGLFSAGDTIIDGGNTKYTDDVRRSKILHGKGIDYMDVGTSGGIWGLERGYCLMIGGPKESFARLTPIFRTLAPGVGTIDKTPGRDNSKSTAEEGFLHCGPAGAGHFVKMVHNGIEYGIMQAYAEGFDLMRNYNTPDVPEELRFHLQTEEIAEVWRRGSVVSSWLLDLTAISLAKSPDLSDFVGSVADSGEGRWTILAAVEAGVPVDVLARSLFARFRSRQDHTFAEKLLSAMRAGFGGHQEKPQH